MLPAIIAGGLGLLGFGASMYGHSQNRQNDMLNYELQKENLEYQKWAQQHTWEREDNAIQRRVADLQAAGLSPVLAAGSAAQTSQPIATTAPERKYRDPSAAIMNAINIMTQGVNIRRTAAEAELTEEKVRSEQQSRDIQLGDFQLRERGVLADEARVSIDRERLVHEARRIGISEQQLEHDAKRIQNDVVRIQHDAHRLFNESERLELERKRSAVLNILSEAQTRKIDEDVISERLRQIGIKGDLMTKVLEYRSLVYDFELSRLMGYRVKDTFTSWDRVNMFRDDATDRATGLAAQNSREFLHNTLGTGYLDDEFDRIMNKDWK